MWLGLYKWSFSLQLKLFGTLYLMTNAIWLGQMWVQSNRQDKTRNMFSRKQDLEHFLSGDSKLVLHFSFCFLCFLTLLLFLLETFLSFLHLVELRFIGELNGFLRGVLSLSMTSGGRFAATGLAGALRMWAIRAVVSDWSRIPLCMGPERNSCDVMRRNRGEKSSS